jgi:hypothetical protein
VRTPAPRRAATPATPAAPAVPVVSALPGVLPEVLPEAAPVAREVRLPQRVRAQIRQACAMDLLDDEMCGWAGPRQGRSSSR